MRRSRTNVDHEYHEITQDIKVQVHRTSRRRTICGIEIDPALALYEGSSLVATFSYTIESGIKKVGVEITAGRRKKG